MSGKKIDEKNSLQRENVEIRKKARRITLMHVKEKSQLLQLENDAKLMPLLNVLKAMNIASIRRSIQLNLPLRISAKGSKG